MKPIPALSLSLLSLGFALGPVRARADEPASPPAPPAAPANPQASPTDGGESPVRHRHERRGWRLAELTEKLGLSADQQKTVGAIISGGDSQAKELRGDESVAQEDKREKLREIMSSTRSQIRAVLTPDQQKLFDALPVRGEKAKKPDAN